MSKTFLKSFDRVILHFDGDSFFASVEQVMNYRLRGKPLVTGGERGAITSASIEAKRKGVNRGLTMRIAKEICPELIIVPGDYLSYSIFAHRMYRIVREFTDQVEEYSIDECFADITGLDKVYKKSYEEIALMIKEKLEISLGVTYGVGMGPTKVLAKVASKHKKPAGFTVINPETLRAFLQTLPVGKVWGIGPSLSLELTKLGILTAGDLVSRSVSWLEGNKIAKPCRDTWLELQGISANPISLESHSPKSIIKSRTFSPPSSDKTFILTQLSKNVESACSKARSYGLCPAGIRFYLKTQEFIYHDYDIRMPIATASPSEIMNLISLYFNKVYKPKIFYRATGIVLKTLSNGVIIRDLFGESLRVERQAEVFKVVDNIAMKYGEHSLSLCSSKREKVGQRDSYQKTLDLPFLGVVK